MLSDKQGRIKYHYWVFGITRRGIEPRCSRPLMKTNVDKDNTINTSATKVEKLYSWIDRKTKKRNCFGVKSLILNPSFFIDWPIFSVTGYCLKIYQI